MEPDLERLFWEFLILGRLEMDFNSETASSMLRGPDSWLEELLTL